MVPPDCELMPLFGSEQILADGLTNFQEDASYYFYEGESLACQLDIGELVQEDEEAYQPKFLMLDHLGSTRAEITFAGISLVPTVSDRYDYMPFGQFINVPATAPEQVCFTGKPRDGESKLDFFGARYYSQFLCRWSAPDQLFADSKSDNPQSWNLYQYVRNNPVIHVDNNGKATEIDIILRDSPAFDMAAAYQSFWSVGEVTLYKTTVKELVDVVLNEARSDKITDLEISGHGGLGAITIGRESVQLSTIPGQIIDPAHVTEFNRLNGKFADGGTITFNMCGPNSKKERVDPNLVNEMIDERKQVLQEIANATGAIVRAPSGGYVALSQGNAKGSYWIIAKPAAASANSQDAKQSNTSDKPDQN